MAAAKNPITLELNEREMAALEQLSESKDMSKEAVMRQALRFYQMVDFKQAQGCRLVFEGDAQREEKMVKFLPPASSM